MRVVLGFILLATIALGVAFAMSKRPQPMPWAARIDDEILHAPSNHWPRPSLGDGGTAHFGDVLESDWDSLEELFRRWDALDNETRIDCATSMWGDGLPLRPECRQWAADARAKLPLVARATEGSEAGPPSRFDPLRSIDLSHAGDVMVALRIAALDTAIRVAELHSEDQYEKAVDSCVLALAVVRDFEWGAGTIAYVRSDTGAMLTFLPCANAVLDTSPERRARFEAELDRIRAGRPPLAHAFTLSRTERFINVFGRVTPREVLDRADPKVKASIDALKAPLDEKSLRAGWPWFSEYEDGLVNAASLPPEKRRAAFNALKSIDRADFYTDDNLDFEAYRAVDAVFEGLAVFARIADDAQAQKRWPERPPQGAGVRFTRGDDGLTMMLDLAQPPIDRADGGLTRRPNEWLFPPRAAWSH